jgi:hypothetical protein
MPGDFAYMPWKFQEFIRKINVPGFLNLNGYFDFYVFEPRSIARS